MWDLKLVRSSRHVRNATRALTACFWSRTGRNLRTRCCPTQGRGIIILITQVSKFLTYIIAKAMQYATEPKETHFPKDVFEWDAANFR